MSNTTSSNVFWPPKGWKHFESLKNISGQSVTKDPVSAKVKGLVYNIESTPVYYADNLFSAVHDIRISGWEYNILGESVEYPIISFFLQDRAYETSTDKSRYISQLKVKDKLFPVTNNSAQRSYMVALLLIKQIDAGVVSDVDRILSMYKVHPTQSGLYKLKNFVKNAFFCYGANSSDDKISKAD